MSWGVKMIEKDIHLYAPAFMAGCGAFKSAAPTGSNSNMDRWMRPGSFGIGDKETAQYQKAIVPHHPVTIKATIEFSIKYSSTFTELLNRSGINLTNYHNEIISTIEISGTTVKTKKISLQQTFDIQESVINLTHELSNRINCSKFLENEKLVQEGKISPLSHAKKCAELEVFGEINQIKVASEIGYRYGEKDKDALIDRYCRDPQNTKLEQLVIADKVHLKEYEQNGVKLKKHGEELKKYNEKYKTNLKFPD